MQNIISPLGLVALLNGTDPCTQPPSVDRVPQETTVRRHGHLLTRESPVPTVIFEMFHLNNPDAVAHYSTPCGMRGLMSALAQGILAYNDFSVVYVDEGHGRRDQGFTRGVGGIPEYQFTHTAADLLEEILREQGVATIRLRHDEMYPAVAHVPVNRRRAQLRALLGHVEPGGILVSLHANNEPSLGTRNLAPWSFYAQDHSQALARMINEPTTKYFCGVFPTACRDLEQ